MSTPLHKNSWLRDPWVWALTAAAAILLLAHLQSSGLLWQDEAETAVLAKNVLRFGYPKVFDGVNRVNPGLVTGPFESWSYHPWLQFYVAALSFLFFGATTVAARLPFAIIGVFCVLSSYAVARLAFRSQAAARLASVVILTSVPLLLHFRQCRYYSLATLGTLGIVWAYFRAREGKRWSWEILALSFIVLFHSHHGAFLPTAVVIALDLWKYGIPSVVRKRAWTALTVAVLATVPWLFVLNVGQHQGTFSGREISHHLQFYFRQINHYIFPFYLLGIAVLLDGRRFLNSWKNLDEERRHRLKIIGWIIAANLAFIVVVPWQRHFRYLIHLIPLFLMLEAGFVWVWLKDRPAALGAIVGLLLLTDFLHYSAPYVAAQAAPRLRAKIQRDHGLVAPEFLLFDYGYELTHNYEGPLSGIIGELQRSARAGETAKTPYDDHAIIFYTGLQVEDLNRFSNPTTPNWIIPRKDWVSVDFYNSTYFKSIESHYQKIETQAPDIVWENRPDPGYHKFKTVKDAPRVVLYHRTGTASSNP